MPKSSLNNAGQGKGDFASFEEIDIAEAPQLWELVLKSLRLQIYSGAIPSGTQLVENELAAKYGVSRGPIRDAFASLEKEGLIVREPRRGAYVIGITREDVREIYELREMLESRAVDYSCPRLTEEDGRRMERCIERMVELRLEEEWVESGETDMEFHRIYVRAAGHRRLLQMWELISSSMLAMTVITASSYPNLIEETQRGHSEIMRALMEGDAPAAKRAISLHIANAQEIMLKVMGREGRASD